MRFYRAGATYHARIHQNKPGLPWLMMFHGFMGSGSVFEPIIPELASVCNPVTVDLLGHGKTSAPAEAGRFETEEQVKDISSILDRLQITELYLYGYSMGGRLALQFAAANREKLKGLILESTHCGISDQKEKAERQHTDLTRAEEIETDFSRFLEKWATMSMFKPEEKNTRYYSVMKHQKPELMAASLRGFGSGVMPSVCNELKSMQFKILMIAGADDQKYVEKMSEMAHLCEDSDFKVLDETGHRAHAGKPNKFAELIKQYITQNYG